MSGVPLKLVEKHGVGFHVEAEDPGRPPYALRREFGRDEGRSRLPVLISPGTGEEVGVDDVGLEVLQEHRKRIAEIPADDFVLELARETLPFEEGLIGRTHRMSLGA